MKPSKQALIAQQLNSGKLTPQQAAKELRKLGLHMAADLVLLTN
jgi:hypothetical protein